MEFRVLGPIEVLVGGRSIPLGGPRQKAMLAALLLRPNVNTPYRSLVPQVWDAPTGSAQANLRRFTWKLRPLLHDPGEPCSRLGGDAGVLLRVEPGESDVGRFGDLAERGREALRTGDTAGAADLLGRALALWRGEPFTGAEPSLPLTSVAGTLNEQRTAATLLHASALIDLGEQAAAAGTLQSVLDGDPTREEAARLLMLALYRDGRRSEALDVFRGIRERLADEFGIDPGPELTALHRGVLTDAAALSPDTGATDLLPRGIPCFTGREEALSRLDALLIDGGPSFMTLSGTAGVGKTSLAVHWARRVRDRFPDGVLYADLRGFSPDGEAADPYDVLGVFLESLGFSRERVPADRDMRAGRYRAALSNRRVLLVLDNARDAAQVRLLLPDGEHCRVLVTSRNTLTGLVATEAAVPVALDPMTAAEGADLMDARLGRDRTAKDPEASKRLVELCAGLPLALAVTCAQAAVRPDVPLSALARQLASADDGLDGFSDGDPSVDVRSVFSWSYAALGPDAARLFRLLSLHPAPDWSVQAAASVAGEPVGRITALLSELETSHMIMESGLGRYGFHDLLRRYASELSALYDPIDDRRSATRRMFGHYVHSARAALHLIGKKDELIALPPPEEGVSLEPRVGPLESDSWLRSRLPVITACVHLAAEMGLDAHIGGLAWAARTRLMRDGRGAELSSLFRPALKAAEQTGDELAQAYAHRMLGVSESLSGKPDAAIVHYEIAGRLYERLDDRLGRARVHRHLALAAIRRGRLDEALRHNRMALPLFEQIGHHSGEADTLNGLGWTLHLLGENPEAQVHCERAIALNIERGDEYGAAKTWDSLANIHHSLGEHTRALECVHHALESLTRAEGRTLRAGVLETLGILHQAAGEVQAAREAWQLALEIHEESGSLGAVSLRERLARLP